MNESITSRVSRLISGSINALVDKAESLSPELIMKETIREVDSAIDEVKILLGKDSIELKKTKVQLESEKLKYEKLSEQIEIAISENREDLAKVAISRQMDIEVQIPILEETLHNITENIKKLEHYIDALNGKKREMQNELKEFSKINKEEKNSYNLNKNLEEAQEAFRRVNKLEKKGIYNDNDLKLAELDKLSRDNRVLERLESIKASRQ